MGDVKTIMSSSLGEAKRKIQENNFAFHDLPADRNDASIWNRLLDAPYNLSVPELSALKNDRCPLPGMNFSVHNSRWHLKTFHLPLEFKYIISISSFKERGKK